MRALRAPHSRHIPGNPNIIAKNMPAAAGLAAASTLYNTADKDGSTIAALTNALPTDPLFGNPGARYDALKFNWLGSIGKLQNVCATWHPVAGQDDRASADARGHRRRRRRDLQHRDRARALNALLGTRFKVVAGYDPGAGLTMAVERGEAEGICGLSWSTMKASRPHWIKDKLLNVIVQMGLEKLRRVARRPERARSRHRSRSRQVLELILIRQETGRPFAAPPGVPADRLAALRAPSRRRLRTRNSVADADKVRWKSNR